MPARCVVKGCTLRHSGDAVSMHGFPKDDKLRHQWIQQVRRTNYNWNYSKSAHLCSIHFAEDCFELRPLLMQSLGFKRPHKHVLKPGAVPTIFESKSHPVSKSGESEYTYGPKRKCRTPGVSAAVTKLNRKRQIAEILSEYEKHASEATTTRGRHDELRSEHKTKWPGNFTATESNCINGEPVKSSGIMGLATALKMEATWDVDEEQPEVKREVFRDEDDNGFSTYQETTPRLGHGTHRVAGTGIKSENTNIKMEAGCNIKMNDLNDMFSDVPNSKSSSSPKILDITEIKWECDHGDQQIMDFKAEEDDILDNSPIILHNDMQSDNDLKNAISVFECKNSQTSVTVGQCFEDVSDLSVHKGHQTAGKGHRCNVCGRSFKYISQMSDHMTTHTGLPSEKPYKCTACNKGFSTVYSRSGHMRMHPRQGLVNKDLVG